MVYKAWVGKLRWKYTISHTLGNMVYKAWVGKLRWKYTISHIWMLMEVKYSLVMTYILLKCLVSESLIWSNISWLFILMLTLYWTLWTFVYLMDIWNISVGLGKSNLIWIQSHMPDSWHKGSWITEFYSSIGWFSTELSLCTVVSLCQLIYPNASYLEKYYLQNFKCIKSFNTVVA